MAGRIVLSTVLAVAAGLALLAPYPVQAQDKSSGNAKQDPFALYIQAGASSEQIAQIHQLVDDFTEAQKQRGKAMVVLMKDMHTLSLQPDPDSGKVMDKQGEINKSANEMANAKLKLMLKIRSVLSPEQKQRLVQLIQPPPPNPNQ